MKGDFLARVPRSGLAPVWFVLAGLFAIESRLEGVSFTNSTLINIPSAGATTPYPSSITVSGVTGVIVKATVTLRGLEHDFPDDLDVLLVGPTGQKTLLMSDAGGANGIRGVSLTFSNAAAASLPDSGQIISGTFRPTDYGSGDVLPGPAPAGPYFASLNLFNNTDPNGIWSLFVHDDTTGNGPDAITNGWHLTLDTAVPPAFIQHPQSQVVNPGSSVTFTSAVTGTPPFGYQWTRNGQVIVPFGQGSNSLTINNVQATNAGTYAVEVTNVTGFALGAVSSNAVLNVFGPLTLVDPPQSETNAEVGGNYSLSVTAAGTPPLYYQWHLNGVPLPGESGSTLSLSNVQPASGGSFSVIVFNESQSEYLLPPPALFKAPFTTGPPPADHFADRPRFEALQGTLQGNSALAGYERDEPIVEGGGKTVWVEWLAPVTGIATFTARGSAFDTMIGVFTGLALDDLELVTSDDDRGGFNTSMVKFNALAGTRYQIMLDGFDLAGIGGEFTLNWLIEETTDTVPVIVVPPAPLAVLSGSNAVFDVIATNPPGMTFQWFFNGAPILGATQRLYSIAQAQPEHVGYYSLQLRSPSGHVTDSGQFDLQIASTADALMNYKLAGLYNVSQNGNRPGAGFIAIGLGDTDLMNASITNSGGSNSPCIPYFSNTKFRTRGLEATNTGVIFATTAGSGVNLRAAVYREPMLVYTQALDCDTTSWMVGEPAKLKFNATNGLKYIVVTEAFQNDGVLNLTSAMGIAPPVTNAPQYHFVPAGGSLLLSMPATNWIPLPGCQWFRNGDFLTGMTNVSLQLSNFNELQVGTYSVIMSNFVDVASNTVAIVDLASPFLTGRLGSSGGNPSFIVSATNTAPFVLQTTTNLDPSIPWSSILTNQKSAFTFSYTNLNILAEPRRFFRTACWPSGP